jgi:hypothetical protein
MSMDYWCISRLTLLISLTLAYMHSFRDNVNLGVYVEWGGIVKQLDLTRKISVFVFASTLMHMIQNRAPHATNLSSVDGVLSFAMWPLFESFFKSCLTIVCVVYISGSVAHVSDTLKPELNQVITGLQYMFAEQISPLIVDYRFKRLIAVFGLIFMGQVSKWVGRNPYSAGHVVYSAMYMVWVNSMVLIVMPDTYGNALRYTDILATIALAFFIQALKSIAPEVSMLQGPCFCFGDLYRGWVDFATVFADLLEQGMLIGILQTLLLLSRRLVACGIVTCLWDRLLWQFFSCLVLTVFPLEVRTVSHYPPVYVC